MFHLVLWIRFISCRIQKCSSGYFLRTYSQLWILLQAVDDWFDLGALPRLAMHWKSYSSNEGEHLLETRLRFFVWLLLLQGKELNEPFCLLWRTLALARTIPKYSWLVLPLGRWGSRWVGFCGRHHQSFWSAKELSTETHYAAWKYAVAGCTWRVRANHVFFDHLAWFCMPAPLYAERACEAMQVKSVALQGNVTDSWLRNS